MPHWCTKLLNHWSTPESSRLPWYSLGALMHAYGIRNTPLKLSPCRNATSRCNFSLQHAGASAAAESPLSSSGSSLPHTHVVGGVMEAEPDRIASHSFNMTTSARSQGNKVPPVWRPRLPISTVVYAGCHSHQAELSSSPSHEYKAPSPPPALLLTKNTSNLLNLTPCRLSVKNVGPRSLCSCSKFSSDTTC